MPFETRAADAAHVSEGAMIVGYIRWALVGISLAAVCGCAELSSDPDPQRKAGTGGDAAAATIAPEAIAVTDGQLAGGTVWKSYCWEPIGKTVYRQETPGCHRGDQEISASDYERIAGGIATEPDAAQRIYCWDPRGGVAYFQAGGSCAGTDRQITEEQFKQEDQKRKATAGATAQGAVETPPSGPAIDAPASPPAAEGTLQAALDRPAELDLENLSFLGSGSGFFVSAGGYLLTNDHVVKDCPITALAIEEGVFRAQVVAADPEADLALVRFAGKRKAFAAFSNRLPEPGDDTFVIGFPLYSEFWDIKVTKGIISGLSGPDGDRRLVQVSAPIQPGNSGGPLVNEAGLIVGVVVSKRGGLVAEGVVAEGIGFAVAPEVAASFLKHNGVHPTISPSTKRREARELVRDATQWTVPLLCFSEETPG